MENLNYNTKIMNFVQFLKEYICLEDFADFQMMAQSYNFGNINKENYTNYILVNFLIEKKLIEKIMKQNYLKRYYDFCKVYNKYGSMNILLNRNANYTNDEILNKIKSLSEKTINKYLKIDELSYLFIEEKEVKNDNNYDKIFELKSLGETGRFVKSFKNNSNNNNDNNSDNNINNNNLINNQSNSKNVDNLNNNCNITKNILNNNNAFNCVNNICANNNNNLMYNNNNFMNGNNLLNNYQMNNMGMPFLNSCQNNNNFNFFPYNNNSNNYNILNLHTCTNKNIINSNNNNYSMNFLNSQNSFNNIQSQNFPMLNKMNSSLNYPNNFINNNNLSLNNNNIMNNNSYNNKVINEPINNETTLFTKQYENFFPLIGLRNEGLTCYMGATLQCLLHIPELTDYFLNKYPKEKGKLEKISDFAETKGYLSQAFYEVVHGVYQQNFQLEIKGSYFFNYYSYSPEKFNKLLSYLNPQFSRFQSNDSKDLLLYLFQSMHEELNYYGDKKLQKIPRCNQLIQKESFNFFLEVNCKLNLSIFSYLFYGITKSTTTCSSCSKILYNFQYFQFLSFPVCNYAGKELNIFQGFKDFIKPEEMKGDNKCYCQKCKALKDARVVSQIYYTPPYLIINFDYGKDKKYIPKKIDFGELIDIEGFTDENCQHKGYSLIAVSTHIGKSGNSGHYVAYCKNLINNKWYLFNDSSCNETKFEKVKSYSPYILVYKRLD